MTQSFAMFVGLSILFGRVYFQSYIDNLGLPLSEANLNVVDYSVVATRVTLVGIAIPVIYFVFNLFGPIGRTSEWKKSIIAMGVLFIALPMVYVLLIADTREEQAFDPGVEALLFALMLGIASAGGRIIASGIPRTISSSSGSTEGSVGGLNFRYVTLSLAYVFLAVYALIYSLDYSYDAGKIDANHTLMEAPRAQLEFTTSSSELMDEVCSQGSQECYFRVVRIGDKFVYLLPEDTGNSSNAGRLYAVPTYDIRMIAYTD